ncbi:MAG: polysaccharide biosynthesis C-terminal domain-containing protein [Lactobacillaceae bacterium]|jgi:O-antigen/teichoic acid export membrane protein|nr:polysaccharide biosynthesis C-terminal domain-containing protein [Lactobacillaceae bacterium]
MRLLREYFNRVSYELINIIIPLVPLTYLARVLGANGLGIQAWSLAFVEVLAIILLSPANLLGEWKLVNQRDDQSTVINIFWNVMALRVGLAFIAVLAFFGLMALLQPNTWIIQEYTHELYLAAWLILGAFLDISWLYQGIGQQTQAVLQSSFSKIFMFLFILIIVKTPNDVDAYILMVALVQIFGNSLLWLRLPKFLLTTPKLALGTYIKPLLAMTMSIVGFHLFTVLGRLMMPLFALNMESWVGYYDSALKLLSVGIVIVIAIGITMLPRFYQKFENGRFADIETHLRNSLENVSAFGSALMFGTIAIATPFIKWFMGAGYLPVAKLMIGLAPLILLLGWTTVIGGQFLRVAGRMRLVNVTMLAGLVINVGLNFTLIPEFAAYGAVMSLVAAQTGIFVLQLIFARDIISIKMLIEVSWKYLVAGVLMLVVVDVVKIFSGPYPTFTVLEITVGMIVYAAAVFAMRSRLVTETKQVIREYKRFFQRGWK